MIKQININQETINMDPNQIQIMQNNNVTPVRGQSEFLKEKERGLETSQTDKGEPKTEKKDPQHPNTLVVSGDYTFSTQYM